VPRKVPDLLGVGHPVAVGEQASKRAARFSSFAANASNVTPPVKRTMAWPAATMSAT
jgi:hypothetical protein